MESRLTLIERLPTIKGKHPRAIYQCTCGNTKEIQMCNITRGHTKSCGCYSIESHRTHGYASNKNRRPEHKAYSAAKYRCNNPNADCYENYGGRGIEFRFKDFQEFHSELGDRPSDMSLDRIDNDGHYEAGNVRWATRKQQNWNKRHSGPLPKVRTTQL